MGCLVALAEDNETLRDLLEYQLDNSGYEVIAANDGAELWEQLEWFAPDLVILDVMMPKLDGMQVLRRLREGEAPDIDREVPVILVTSRGREEDVLDGFEWGATDYITKPFRPKDLVTRVGRILE